jgi:tetratricopeptide (TPR) repeat protein
MPADLQRTFVYEISPAIRAGNVKGGLIDVLLLSKVKALVADPESDIDRAIQVRDGMDAALAGELAGIQNLTDGARELVRQAGNYNEAIAAIFSDKLFRAYLRENITPRGLQSRLNAVISGSSRLRQASPAARTNGRPAAREPTGERPSATPDEEIFTYRYAKADHKASITEVAGLLETSEQADRVYAQFNGLLRSELATHLLQLDRRVEHGALTAAPDIAAVLRVYAVRVLLQFNAVETASRMAEALLNDPAAFPLLPDGERLRLRTLIARCALRSGRAAEAVSLYERLWLEQPQSAAAVMNVVSAAFSLKPDLARGLAKSALLNNLAVSDADLVFAGDILISGGDLDAALIAFHRLLLRGEGNLDAYVGLANLALARGDREGWREAVGRYLDLRGREGIVFVSEEPLAPFSVRLGEAAQTREHDLVTVVMTTFNAAETVGKALDSILAQTCANLEIIVVDDVSSDGTQAILQAYADRESRVRWLQNPSNTGTYVAKNRGIEIARGRFVTFHDSDDWMHPRRIERHLDAMTPDRACSTSDWLRMDADGRTVVRRGGPYTHINPASTFLPRQVFERLGPFDQVRTGADAELLSRVRLALGQKSVTHIGRCLALGLHHENSLTQSGVAAFDEFRYSPVRLAYTEAWVAWQLEKLLGGERDLRLIRTDLNHPFPAPRLLSPWPLQEA